MKFTYLLLNLFTISIPLARSFEPKINFVSKWKYFIPANIITAIFFLVWDYFKTKHGVWQFNDEYVVGLRFFGMPVEEYLFFITVPYACIFIYETIILFIKKRFFSNSVKKVVAVISILSIVTSAFFFHKAYTFSVLFIGGVVFLIVSLTLNAERLEKFILTYSVSIVPMLFVNGILTGLPVVIYDNTHNLGFRIGSIPIEDFLYSAILLAMNIGLYEMHRNKRLSKTDYSNSDTLNQNALAN